MSKKTTVFFRGTSVIALALATASIAPAAFAQESAGTSDEIVVTGSHLGKSAFTSPTPVNVVGDERMKALAIPSVADALNQIPSFRAIATPSITFFRASGNIGAKSMDLRGLGLTRTLVLVDGRRFVPSGDNGAIDLNAIPSALVKRSEVVTGGASAAYGADAVAGVVNVILDTKFTGFKTDFSAGIAEEGDAQNYFASVAGGRDFAGGRGHIIAGLEFQNEQGIGRCDNRDYCKNYTNYIANPGYNTVTKTSTNGLPANLVLHDVRFVENRVGILTSVVKPAPTVDNPNATVTLTQQVNNGTAGAGALPAGLRGLQFSNDGQSLVPFQFGNYLSGLFMQGGDASVDQLFGLGDQPLVAQTQHASGLAHADYDLTDSITASAEVLYSNVIGKTRAGYVTEAPVGGAALGVNINNPFISPAVRAQLLAADPGITQINVNVAKPESGINQAATTRNDTFRTVLALKGEAFESHNVTWDVSYEYGQTDGLLKARNLRATPVDSTAANAITPPPGYTGPVYTTPLGAPVICNSSATNPTDGCIPINFFGLNSLTPAVLAKYQLDAWQTRHIKQNAIAANLRGDLFDLWGAGPVQGAIGAEWREDSVEGATDPVTASGGFVAPQGTNLPQVKRDVTEGYIETSIPLLANQPFAKNLTIDGAKRWTSYSTQSGSVSTWKAGLVYEPNDQILVRLTQSSDIRAPTAAELNPNFTATPLPQADPFSGATHNINTITGGNPGLKLEESDTKTAGVVLKPAFIPGFRISTDYYNIKVSNAIDSLTGAVIMSACNQQNLLCDLIRFTGTPKASAVDTIFSNFQNLSKLHAEGVEVVANYGFDALAGHFDASVNANYVIDLRNVGATGLVTKLDGVTGNAGSVTNIQGVPQYKLDGVLTYSRDNWSLTGHGRYIPEGILDPTKVGPEDAGYNVNLPNSQNTNRVDSRFYLDLSGTFSPTMTMFGGKTQLYGAINNVFDTDEPEQLRLIGNPLQFDPVGRAYRLGIRANW